MDKEIKVLSTKKLDPDFLRNAGNEGLVIDCVDCIEKQPLHDLSEAVKAIDEFENIAVTSSFAWECLHGKVHSQLATKRFFVVGNRLQDLLKQYNCEVVVSPHAQELASKIKNYNPKKVLYLKGNLSLETIENELKNTGIDISSMVIYETKLLTPNITELDKYQYIWFFSPSGVRSFNKNNIIPSNTNAVAIGKTTANFLAKQNPLVATHPDLNELKNTTLKHNRYATI